MTRTSRHLDPFTFRAALNARFAGLGIAAFAALALATAAPQTALAEQAQDQPDDESLAAQVDAVPEAEADESVEASEPAASETEAVVEGESDPAVEPSSEGDATAAEEETPAEEAPEAPEQPSEQAEDEFEPAEPVQGWEAADPAQDAAATVDETTAQEDASASVEEVPAASTTTSSPKRAAAANATPAKAAAATPAKAADATEQAKNVSTWDASKTHYYDAKGNLVKGKTYKIGDAYYYFNNKGEVLKAGFASVNGRIYVADKNGVLASLADASLKQGFQRLKGFAGTTTNEYYYLYRDKTGVYYAKPGYSTDGMRHYTRPEGYVVRYAWQNKSGTKILLANKKGKLVALSNGAKKGWKTSKGLSKDGKSHLYYLYKAKTGAYYAKPGYSTAGYAHYTRPEGYVVTGAYLTGETKGSRIYLADKDGRLARLESGKKSGWVTSSSWGAKNKRYLLIKDTSGADKGAYYATYGFSTKKYAHYTTKKGYVKTGAWKSGSKVYVADGTGKMLTLTNGKSQGWVTSKDFAGTGAKERYYLYRATSGATKGASYAKLGFSKDGYAHVTTTTGYVARSQVTKDALTGKIYATNAKGEATATSRTKIIEKYVEFMLDITNDRRFGYSQPNRWTGVDVLNGKRGTGDFDCSSLVITALRRAGLPTGKANETADMKQYLTKLGWTATYYSGKPSSLQVGDILLSPGHHVEILVEANSKTNTYIRAGAHNNEYRGIGAGTLGDQLQKVANGDADYAGEISLRNRLGYSSNSDVWFSWVLRYTG